MQYKVKNVRTLNEMANSLCGKAAMGLEYLLFRTGPLTMPPSQLGAFAKSDPSQPTPNIEWHVQPLSLDKFGDPLHPFPAITPSVCNLRPTSRGWVRIKSPDAAAYPEIKLNYLSTPEDRKVAVDGMRFTRRIMASKALAKYEPEEFRPGSAVKYGQGSGKSRRRTRHHHLPPGRHLQDGQRPDGGGGRPPARARRGPAARHRRLGHAAHHLRQYQCADLPDRRKRRADDPRGRAIELRAAAPI